MQNEKNRNIYTLTNYRILVLRKSYYAYACQGIYRYVGYEYNYAEEMQNELIMRLETTIDECMKTSSSTENLRSALSETVNDFRKNIEEDDRKYLYLVIIVIPKSWTNFITHYWTNYFTPCVVVTTGGTFAFRHHGDVSQPLEALTYFRKNKKKKVRNDAGVHCPQSLTLFSLPPILLRIVKDALMDRDYYPCPSNPHSVVVPLDTNQHVLTFLSQKSV